MKKWSAWATVLAVLLCACARGAGETVTTLGSTSMERVMGTLGEQYMLDHADVTVSVEGGGSGAGVEGVLNGTADIGLSSRALTQEEAARGLRQTVLALDGIAVIVGGANPVDELTVEQIAKVFTGEIQNWSELGGADAGIAPVGREAGSGTREGFESVTGTAGRCVLSQELTSAGAVIEAVRGNAAAGAIGYASLSSVEGQEGIKAVSVNGVPCTEENILQGSYAIQRPFVLVTREGLSKAAGEFFAWAVSPEAADLIRRAGAVPAVSPHGKSLSKISECAGCVRFFALDEDDLTQAYWMYVKENQRSMAEKGGRSQCALRF